jgi:hypothetical protein
MWILDALTDVPVKKPFFVMWAAIGAASLLLSYFFATNPLDHPLIFAVISGTSVYLWHTRKLLMNILLVPFVLCLAWYLLPHHMLLFCALTSLSFGKLLFSDQFRIWKWLAAAALLTATFPILSSWSNIVQIQTIVPYPWTTMLQSAVLAFCVLFSLLPYQVRKDSVLEAFEHYQWKTSAEAFRLAVETVDLYQRIKQMVKIQERNPAIAQDLEDYTERVIHQCFQLHQIATELSGISVVSLEKQIAALKEKLNIVDDATAKQQYEQALGNKHKQIAQFEKLNRRHEQLLAQIVNYNSSLENIRLAYSHQNFAGASAATENIEMFMEGIKARAEGFHASI